ncbi:hypothetical protein AX14_001245 [Amanita brunnescens Koide BX004]|nr:hypothetical protein AX14_001245 [Amanita brunnescens Koide BX004]
MATQLLQEYPELIPYSRQDLEDMLVDPNYFQAVLHSLDKVKVMYQAQTELSMANEAIAKRNLELQERLYQLRSETKEAFDEAKGLEARWKELEKEQREVYSRISPQFLHMRLRHGMTAQDDKSEALASEFIQQLPNASLAASGTGTPGNGLEVDEFVREYKELRKVYHKRAIWNERWSNGQVEWSD